MRVMRWEMNRGDERLVVRSSLESDVVRWGRSRGSLSCSVRESTCLHLFPSAETFSFPPSWPDKRNKDISLFGVISNQLEDKACLFYFRRSVHSKDSIVLLVWGIKAPASDESQIAWEVHKKSITQTHKLKLVVAYCAWGYGCICMFAMCEKNIWIIKQAKKSTTYFVIFKWCIWKE